MFAVHPTGTEPEKQRPDPQASPQAVAERGLRNSRYAALKHVSCAYQGGVLVLRGCLPTYYLKQIAQEVVAHQVQGVSHLENQIQVVRPGSRRRRG
jgi:osmotically-inducible protein OsmY